MACQWYNYLPVGREWIPSKVQITQDVDDEGRKIFEAFYGMPIWHNTTKNYRLMSVLDRVFGVTNDNEARTIAEFAVGEFNNNKKKKKQENQPPLQFLKVVGAVRIRHLYKETYFLMTLQVVDGSIEPRKFFAKVIQFDCRPCKTKHLMLDEFLPVDDDLAQLKHPMFKIRREEKLFLEQVEAEFEQKKSLFLSKINTALGVLHEKGKKQILEVVLSDLQKLAQFKEPNDLEFEGVTHEEGEGCECGQCGAMQDVVVERYDQANSSFRGPITAEMAKRFGYPYEELSPEEKACWPRLYLDIGIH